MSTLVVYESMWGNTRAVAEAVAGGLGPDVPVVEVAQAPSPIPPEVDLLVLGGPTHAFSMSRPSTRKDAIDKGAGPEHGTSGIRDWLTGQPPSDRADVATFDTRLNKMRYLPGSAAKAAAKQVERLHLGRLIAVESFYVVGMEGPLLDHELDRAQVWGANLAARHAGRVRDSR